MTSRKHPSVPFWITAALLAVVVGYPLSFGPACWLADRANISRYNLSFYVPLIRHSPELIFRVLERYSDLLDHDLPPRIRIELYVMRHPSPD